MAYGTAALQTNRERSTFRGIVRRLIIEKKKKTFIKKIIILISHTARPMAGAGKRVVLIAVCQYVIVTIFFSYLASLLRRRFCAIHFPASSLEMV